MSGEGEEREWEEFGREMREFLSREIEENEIRNHTNPIYRQIRSSMDRQVSKGVEN